MADLLDRLKAALADRYQIERELGSGGMATVYLAQDLKHERQVAVKVLRPELAAALGSERFLREIKVAANLNHPRILPLHDSGEADSFLYYVMPYVEGESLRDKLNREKQLSVDKAIAITKQVGAALDYAHDQGVIHRDIKPENILIHQGEALVADFGIALAVSVAGGTRITDTGLSLGTPEYMSPEQATGERQLDARSDVYSVGAVTYEMLVGDPPHMGNTIQAIIAKVVSVVPQPVSRVRHTVPSNVDAAVMKALAKTPADRFASGAEFAEALANPAFALPTAAGVAATITQREGPWKRVAVVTTAIAAFTTLFALWALLRLPPEAPKNLTRVSIPMPDGEEVVDFLGPDIAISRDGRRLVYFGPSELFFQLWLRPLDSLHARPLPGTENTSNPVFSPDGDHVAFYQSGSLKVVSTSGAPPEEIVGSVRPHCVDWASDGMIYFGSANGGISRVMATGGEPEVLTVPDTSRGELHNAVDVLPNGAGALFVRWRGQYGNADIAVLDFGTGEVRRLVSGLRPQYAESGHMVYVRSDSVLVAVPFDQDRMVVSGQVKALLDGVSLSADGTAEYTLSETGSLLYHKAINVQNQAVWVDQDGVEREIDPDWTGEMQSPALSPDDSRLAINAFTRGSRNIWIKTLDRGPFQRLTFEGSRNLWPVWTPDGRFVTFGSNRTGQFDLWQKRADFSRSATQLHEVEVEVEAFPSAWSPDGRWLVFSSDRSGNPNIYAIQPEIDSIPVPLVATEFSERSPALSPDGRWLAYSSDLSGHFQVYVQPFPNVDDVVQQVSVAGGMEPTWAQNGRELFYVSGNQEMVVADVETSPVFRRLGEHVLFSTADYVIQNLYHSYAVSHDDQRFVMLKRLRGSRDEVMLVLNFFEELKQRVGTGND
jgi:serine/threonine-protein kinase